MSMRLGAVGGLGLMLSPAAKHLLSAQSPARVITVHDRGNTGETREKARAAWREHGAELVGEISRAVRDSEGQLLDGVIVCAGKNADDQPIIGALARELSLAERPAEPRFILHLSTVSSAFAQAAAEFCQGLGVSYGNYPLTGGPAGAEAGTMLILAGGDRSLYDHVEPVLDCLGKPRYFGPEPSVGAKVKLTGHYLVFNGLHGIASAAALHGGVVQPEADYHATVGFIDFLNSGAGHTRQWELALRRGLAEGNWQTGFASEFAAVDLIYAAQMGIEAGFGLATLLPVLQMALLQARSLGKMDEFERPATGSIYFDLLRENASEVDEYLLQNLDLRRPEKTIENCLKALPERVRASAGLNVRSENF